MQSHQNQPNLWNRSLAPFFPHPTQISLEVAKGRFHVQRDVREKTSRCPLTSAAMTDDCEFSFWFFAKNVENLSDKGKRLLQTSAPLIWRPEREKGRHTNTHSLSLAPKRSLPVTGARFIGTADPPHCNLIDRCKSPNQLTSRVCNHQLSELL